MAYLKQRIYEVAKEMQLMSLATVTEDGTPWVRYMMGKAGEDLAFRFCSQLHTRKVEQIRRNPNVHILLGVENLETARHWLQVAGTAEVTTDRDERHTFWFDELSNYFSGPDDPEYCIIIMRPSVIEFGTMGSTTAEVWKA